MSNFTIHSFDPETKKAKFSVNDSEEVIDITFDDPEAASPTKMMAIFRGYAGDGGVKPLRTAYDKLPIGEKTDCATLV